jgi:tetratricopeptide (TPR) repeat protein
MKSIRIVTVGLLIAGHGIVGCSQRESSEATTDRETAPEAASVTTPRASPAATRVGNQGHEPATAPSATGSATALASFADGEAAFRAKNYKEATAIFEAYVERKPGNGWGYYMLGLSAWKSADFAKAEKAFEQALRIDPGHAKSLVNSARLFIDQQRHDDAVERLTRAAQVDPESPEVHRLLAQTFRAQGKNDEAVEAYRRALEANEHDVWSMNSLALLFLETKRADEALPLLTRAVELRQNVAEFHNNLGVALEHTGSLHAAAEAYSDALLVDPRYQQAKENLARVEAVKGGEVK